MALEAAIGALKVLYKLAKMIKEARDNVIFVREKLENTESIERVVQLALSKVNGKVSEDIFRPIDLQLAKSRRISRQMRMKYEPLFHLLANLGGSASALKAQANVMRKGVLSASMTLSALSIMFTRHFDREEKRDVANAERHCISVGLQSLPSRADIEAGVLISKSEPDESQVDDTSVFWRNASQDFVSQMKVFLRKCNVHSEIRSLIDDINGMAQELKHLYEKAEDQADDGEANGSVNTEHMQVFCPDNPKAKKASHLQTGIELLIQDITKGKGVLTDADLQEAFGDNYAKVRVQLFMRHLGDLETQTITAERFKQFFLEASPTDNIGISVAAICRVLLTRLQVSGLGDAIERGLQSARKIVTPLVPYCISFGLLMGCEDLREQYKDDPDEIAAQDAALDEAKMDERLDMIERFAVDFKDSFDYGFPCDPALMAPIMIEVSTSFAGLGPTLWRRMQLLMAIMAIANVEADKLAIEKVDNDLKGQLGIASTLAASAADETAETLQLIARKQDQGFDATRVLGHGDCGTFWVSSFGRECYEVQWSRFRIAFVGFFGRQNENTLKKLKLSLLDFRGNVTLENLKAFEGNTGSLAESIAMLSKSTKMLKSAVAADEKKLSRSKSTAPAASDDEDGLSPAESKQARLRLYGVIDKM